ncbi:ABC transporter transmembrane domain-containing protein [Janibacter anophelis]|uniref:ABC transporter transmembrane domain-containing protein n=1 Tax=Janibacter anophelis TaxID=319054 RepID=UPI003F8035F9
MSQTSWDRSDDAEQHEATVVPPMPALLRGHRRVLMALLVATAFAHAACAVGAGLLVGVLLGDVGQPAREVLADLGVLALTVAGLGVTRYIERVVAERLGQDYVQQLRRGLVSHAMTSAKAPSLGITIARSTNDLASVRNWVSLGIAPLVALGPLVIGSVAALATLGWQLAAVVAVPLLVLAIVLGVISGPAFERARDLRRRRGSLAARVADTVTAAPGIAAAGGVERELRALDTSSSRVVDAAVHRARTAGLLRAAALVAPIAGSASAATLGAFGIVPAASVAVALTIVGIIAGPVGDAGRIVEYRQNHKAARRIIAPLLAERVEARSEPLFDPGVSRGGRVVVRGLSVDGHEMPGLLAEPGDRILFRGAAPQHAREVFTTLAVPGREGFASVCVDGKDLAHTGPKNRRRRVGYAPVGARIERGTVARAVRYRRPDLSEADGSAALAAVGLAERVARLDEGERTSLRRGGEPLTRQEVARLWVARATIGEPALLLLEHIDDDLGPAGREMLRRVLADYPGVVVMASDRPEELLDEWQEWAVPTAEPTTRTQPAPDDNPAPVAAIS